MIGSQRVTTSVYGSGKGRRLVIHIPGFPPVTVKALAKTLGKSFDTIRKRLRNWDDPAIICSRGGCGGVPLPINDNWSDDLKAAAAISVLPADCKAPPAIVPGWGYTAGVRAAKTIREATPNSRLSRWKGERRV